ncbi:spore coat protein U-like protein [Hydrogenophaga palleronii]|uniref:Spore coat protein U-like protein n=1 Tax=Hydrogenophaga palleronii TaxID=65655 RepID=A0ABU1WQA5_9BURK|nr:spore coat protein U domain-containing protein [Hydrogenophaga palleronii]MDR7151478.1 spore coat protein U-like protein [Hydrogenophaga palleronii]
MFTKQKVSLAAAALTSMVVLGTAVAAQDDSVLTVDATLTSACAVSAGATISFGSFSTLAAVDQTADSGSTFTVACSADMEPAIFATGTRTIINGANSLPFNLSLTSGAVADDLPATLALAAALTVVQDGTEQIVPLYARLAKANFGALPAGAYANGSAVTVSVSY